MQSIETIKQEIESRFQLIITISLFFPILLENLGKITRQNTEMIPVLLGFLVGAYILNYILFQLRKDYLKIDSLRRVNEWLLVGLGVFIVPIFGIGYITLGLPGWLTLSTMYISIIATLLIFIFPILVEVIILFSADENLKSIRSRRKK